MILTTEQLVHADLISARNQVSLAELTIRRIRKRLADIDAPDARVLAVMAIADITLVRNRLIEMGREIGAQ